MLEELLIAAKESGISEEELVEKVQSRYKYFLRDSFGFDNFLRFKNFVKIDMTEDTVKQLGKSYIEKGEFENLKKLEKATGIKVNLSEKEIQKEYTILFKKNCFGAFRELKQMTGIEPKIPMRVIQKVYSDSLTGNVGNPVSYIENCIEQTGIKPSEKIIQKVYLNYFKHVNWEPIEEIEKITGIKPKIPDRSIQKMYRHCLSEGYITTLMSLKKNTGVKFEFTKEEIREAGIQTLLSGSTELSSFKQLQKLTGTEIKLTNDEIQGIYYGYLELGWLKGLKKFKEYTGVEPAPKVYSGVIKFLNTPEGLLRI